MKFVRTVTSGASCGLFGIGVFNVLFSIVVAASTAMLVPRSALAANEDVGDVSAVVAEARAVDDTGDVRRLGVPDDLYHGERVETGPGARMHATFRDGSKLMLGENAILRIDRFLMEVPEPEGGFTVTRGAFRLITGGLNKVRGGTITMRTPVATIGIRGTDFWGLQTQDRFVMALIDNGELSITLPSGTVVLTEPMTVISWEPGSNRPKMDVLTPEALRSAVSTILLPE